MIRNMTPHPLTIVNERGDTVVDVPPSGATPRVREEHIPAGTVPADGTEVPLSTIRYTRVDGLPDRQEGTYLVVSMLTAQAAPDRDDLLVPVGQVRDGQGRIVGCSGLGRLPKATPQTVADGVPAFRWDPQDKNALMSALKGRGWRVEDFPFAGEIRVTPGLRRALANLGGRLAGRRPAVTRRRHAAFVAPLVPGEGALGSVVLRLWGKPSGPPVARWGTKSADWDAVADATGSLLAGRS